MKSTMFHLIVSAGGTAIFALYILFDTSQITCITCMKTNLFRPPGCCSLI